MYPDHAFLESQETNAEWFPRFTNTTKFSTGTGTTLAQLCTLEYLSMYNREVCTQLYIQPNTAVS